MTYYKIPLSKATYMKYLEPTWVLNFNDQPLFLPSNKRSLNFEEVVSTSI